MTFTRKMIEGYVAGYVAEQDGIRSFGRDRREAESRLRQRLLVRATNRTLKQGEKFLPDKRKRLPHEVAGKA